MDRIGIGITTWNRPEYAEKCLRSLLANIDDDVFVALHNDGSDPKHRGAYHRAYRFLFKMNHASITDETTNHGVAWAKNRLCETLLDQGCTWVFLLEDDVLLESPLAVNGYLAAARVSDMHHLSFAHHGVANIGGPVQVDGPIAFYPHSVGAWCLYSREWLTEVGLFDENMVNAFEHVEMELRGFQRGYAPGAGPHRFPDATESRQWLSEIPGSIEHSAIRLRDDWTLNIRNALAYWKAAKPDTFAMMFGPGTPLEDYAYRFLGQETHDEPESAAGTPR